MVINVSFWHLSNLYLCMDKKIGLKCWWISVLWSQVLVFSDLIRCFVLSFSSSFKLSHNVLSLKKIFYTYSHSQCYIWCCWVSLKPNWNAFISSRRSVAILLQPLENSDMLCFFSWKLILHWHGLGGYKMSGKFSLCFLTS